MWRIARVRPWPAPSNQKSPRRVAGAFAITRCLSRVGSDHDLIPEPPSAEVRKDGFLGELLEVVAADKAGERDLVLRFRDAQAPEQGQGTVAKCLGRCPVLQGRTHHHRNTPF